jgi:hypothetical protein
MCDILWHPNALLTSFVTSRGGGGDFIIIINSVSLYKEMEADETW